LQNSGEQIGSTLQFRLDSNSIITGRIAQHIVHNQITLTRMINAYAQPPEILTSHSADYIPQSIVPSMPTALFQPNLTSGQIKLIVDHQNLRQVYFEVLCQTGYRLTATVHIGGGLQKPALITTNPDTTGQSVKLAFNPEFTTMAASQQIYKPEASVVTVLFILSAWITQTNNKLNG
jgi:hypothetical protein